MKKAFFEHIKWLCAVIGVILPLAVNAQIPQGYEPAPSQQALSQNGDFSNMGGTTKIRGVRKPDLPSNTAGAYNLDVKIYSQAEFLPNQGYMTDNQTGSNYNTYSIMSGTKQAGNPFSGAKLNSFPGDPANNVAATSNYLYSNGNVFNGQEYVIWAQKLTNLVVGRYYVFSMYVNNAIEPPAQAPHDPVVRLKVDGRVDYPDGNDVAGPTTLTEAATATTQPLDGWKRVEYIFKATSTSKIFKVTSAAAGINGDDFQMTQVQIVEYRPILNVHATTQVCAGGSIMFTATTPASGTFTYSWTGPNGFTSTQQNPVINNPTIANSGTYSVNLIQNGRIVNTQTVNVTVSDCSTSVPPVVPVTIDKTATLVSNDPNSPDSWDVTLKITSGEVAVPVDVVIVIDQSSSMGGQNIARMNAAKASGQRFVKRMLSKGLNTPGVRIALVSYDHEPHNLSDFVKDTALLCQKIRELRPTWGTHTQAGLKMARDIMAGSNAVRKHIILMSDGLATEQYPIQNVTTADFIGKTGDDTDPIDLVIGYATDNPGAYVSNNPNTTLSPDNPSLNSLVGRRTLPDTKYDYSDPNGRVTFDGSGGVLIYKSEFPSPYYYFFPCNAAINEAQFAKNSGYEIHTIGYDLGNSPLPNKALELTATDASHFFTATPENLNTAFDNIAQTINIGVKQGTVVDIVAPGFIVKNVTTSGDITTLLNVSHGTVTYDVNTRRMTWNVGNVLSSTDATLTYRIYPDMDNIGTLGQINTSSQKGPDIGGFDTNTEAKLNYTNSNDVPNQSMTYPHPTVKPGYGVIQQNYVLVDAAGNPIDANGATATWTTAFALQPADYLLPNGNAYIEPKWIQLDKTNDNLQYFVVTPSKKGITYNGKFYRFVEVPGSTTDGANVGISWKKPKANAYFAYVENRPPVAVPDVNATRINTVVSGNVLTNDKDPEGDPITATPKTNAPTTNGGSVTVNSDGSYTYTPPTGFAGEDSFTYTVCDNHNACSSTTVTIEVLPAPNADNNPPVAVNDNYLASKNKIVNGNVVVNDFDPDGDLNANSVTLVNGGSAATNGSLQLNSNGTFTYTPNNNFVGEVSFTYQVCDNANNCDDATVTINVLPDTDNTTVAVDDAVVTQENSPVIGNLKANDYDPEGNTQIVNTNPVTAPKDGTVVINSDGTFTYTPSAGYVGADRFVYSTCDNGTPKACHEATVYITVEPVNKKPQPLPDVNTTFVDTPVNGNVLTNDKDPEGKPLTVTPQVNVSTAKGGKVTVGADGSYTYTPPTEYVGEDSFTYTVCDDKGNCVSNVGVTIEVTPLPTNQNDAPVAVNDHYKGSQDKNVTGQVLSNDMDPDGDALTVSQVKVDTDGDGTSENITIGVVVTVYGKDENGSIVEAGTLKQNADGTFVFDPKSNFAGTLDYSYMAIDGSGKTDDADVKIIIPKDVSLANSVIALNDAYTLNLGQTSSLTVASTNGVLQNDIDPQNNTITVTSIGTITTANGGTVVMNADGAFTYTPATGFTGEDSFSYTITDNGTPQAVDQATVFITVVQPTTSANPPVAMNDAYTTNEFTPVQGNVSLNDNDPDGDIKPNGFILIDGGTAAANGTLIFNNNGTFNYTPNAGMTGTFAFTYRVEDATGNTDIATVTIEVTPTPENTTVAVDDAYLVNTNSSKVLDVKLNDYDPQGNVIGTPTAVTQPQYGTLSTNPDGTFTYTPTSGYVGTDRFIYSICDNATPQACDRATVYLEVAPSKNYWIGTTDNDWDKITNWTAGIVPLPRQDVEFATSANNNNDPASHDLYVPVGTPKVIGNLINESDKSLVVPSKASVTIGGTVTGSGTSDKAHKIHVKAGDDNNANGTLILAGQPCNVPVYGTVEFYAKGYKGVETTWTDNIEGSPTKNQHFTSQYLWQHFGVPVAEIVADPTFYGAYLRQYDETYNGDNTQFYQKWRDLNNSSLLEAFKGYEITQDAAVTYWIKGQLQHCDKVLTLTRKAAAVSQATGNNIHYGLGQNIFGNSYTAAINIDKMVFPAEVEKTVYLYNTGRFHDWATTGTTISDASSIAAGNYLSVPVNATPAVWDGQIPSQQGFLLRFTDTETVYNRPDATVTLKYADGGVESNIRPQLSPSNSGATPTTGLSFLSVMLESRSTVDRLWLIEQAGTTERFDNGWDGRKFFGTPTAFIYTQTPDGNMQVSANSSIDGTVITHYANGDSQYVLRLKRHNMDNTPLYLLDLKTRSYTELSNEETVYSFTAHEPNVSTKRFMIVSVLPGETDFEGEQTVELLDGYLADNNTLVINNLTVAEGVATIHDVTGRTIARYSAKVGVNRIPVELSAGVYMAHIKAGEKNLTIKFIVK